MKISVTKLQGNVSEQEIEAALHSVAQLVSNHGNKYWPIFERLEQELENRRSKAKRLDKALLKCSNNSTQFGKFNRLDK